MFKKKADVPITFIVVAILICVLLDIIMCLLSQKSDKAVGKYFHHMVSPSTQLVFKGVRTNMYLSCRKTVRSDRARVKENDLENLSN